MEDCQVLKMSDQIRERDGKMHILLKFASHILKEEEFHLALFLNRLKTEGLLCTVLINDRTASLCQAGP